MCLPCLAASTGAGSHHRNTCEWFCNNKALNALHPATNDQEWLKHRANALSTDRYHALALEVWERLPKVPEPAHEQRYELEL